ncbi:MAG TPA: hypothetical protein VJS30_26860 [Paraburkholderia sp.]|nr:hypothetical protein [Paraburkholderia sp.]
MTGIVTQPQSMANWQDQRSSDKYALKRLMVKLEQADAKRHSLNGQYPPKGIFKTTLKYSRND